MSDSDQESIIQELRVEKRKYKAEINKLKDQLEEKDDEIQELKATSRDAKKYKAKIKKLKDELEEKEDELDRMVNEKIKYDETSKIQIKELEEKIKELERSIESKIEEINSKGIKLKEIEYKCNNFETQVQESEENINQLQKDKIELAQTVNDKNKEAEGQIEESKKKNLALQTMIEKINNKENEITELNKILAQHMTDLDLCRNTLQLEKKENENLKNVSNLEQKVKRMEDEINFMKIRKFKTPSNQEKDDKLGQSETYKTDWYPDWWNNHINGIQPNIEEININIGGNDLSRSRSDRSFNEEPENNNKSILDKINKRTGKEFDSLDACISFITNLSNDTRRRNNVQEENLVRPASGDKVRQLEVENEELHDKIYDLESKCKSTEKKYNKQLKSKNEEIEELQEELESAKAKKHGGNKDKIQIKELKEKIEELEGDIESKTEIIKSKDEKIKEIEIKRNNFETRVKELEKEINKFKKDKMELTETIDIRNKETDKMVNALNEDIKKKQQAMEIMKGKIEKKVFEIEELKGTIAQHVGDLDECRSALKTEKEKYGNLNGISIERQKKIEANEKKIKSLENEIHNMKVARFQNTDNTMGNNSPRDSYAAKSKWHPGWWDKHTDPDHNNYQQEKEQKQFTTGIPQKPDKRLQGDAMLVACPNCHTMYSPDEIEHHVTECIAN